MKTLDKSRKSKASLQSTPRASRLKSQRRNQVVIEDELSQNAGITHLDRRLGEGMVSVVGAGPGDHELLTIKALRLLESADVILYDALVSKEILAYANIAAELVHVGKRANHHYVTQAETNRLLVKYAKLGKQVVRLKGGDPFIFGRGGEELQVLKANNIRYEVVPGITAASGCASYAGIPLTHRDYSQAVKFVTAHQKDSLAVDWQSLAKPQQTLVFYMGLMKNQLISDSLIHHGVKFDMPIAVIENGTRPEQRVVTGILSELSELVDAHQLQSPSLIIVGEVAALANELAWFGEPQERNENVAKSEPVAKAQ